MTWKELVEKINKMPEEKQNKQLRVFVDEQVVEYEDVDFSDGDNNTEDVPMISCGDPMEEFDDEDD